MGRLSLWVRLIIKKEKGSTTVVFRFLEPMLAAFVEMIMLKEDCNNVSIG